MAPLSAIFLPPTPASPAVYGLIIGTVSSYQGMRTKGGTEGVGRSATSSVVLSSLFIILAYRRLVVLYSHLFFPDVRIIWIRSRSS